ncbi:MAG TPA: LCP family protein [Streptosporangiaceae bacterium]
MSEWPAGWFREENPPPADAAGAGAAEASEPTVQLPGRGASAGGSGGAAGGQPGYAASGQPDGAAGGQPGYAASGWPEQPPVYGSARTGVRSPAGPRRPAAAPAGGAGRRFPVRRVLLIAMTVVLVLLVLSGLMYFYLDSKLTRSDVLVDYSGRPAAGAGQNWLITGSDSRQGLTRKEERKLHTGVDVAGQRSDTIMLLHIPASGGPAVLISLPRDSYVPIPGYGYNKINAAYSFGGPKLLAKTVQNVTGLQIQHYMGIGFGGLVNVVNAVGGVRMCIPHRVHDQASGLRLKKGCQTLNGGQALAYVRDRHTFASQDLQRVQDQRIFLGALLRKVTSPGTLINPFAAVPAAFGAAGSLQVDSGTHLYQLMQVAFALRNPETTTIPIANANYVTPAGDAVLWDRTQASRLFNDLNTDQPVPKHLLTGSHLGA